MKHLTVRNVPERLAKALEQEKAKRGASMNRTVVSLLCEGLGVAGNGVRSNGLRRLAGTWSARDLMRFRKAVEPTETVDEELWR